MKEFDLLDIFAIVIFSFLGLLLLLLLLTGYDEFYIRPVAADNANSHCQSLGFDQYSEFSRIGIFSKTPVGIKCEYAEKYTDLGVRTNARTNR